MKKRKKDMRVKEEKKKLKKEMNCESVKKVKKI